MEFQSNTAVKALQVEATLQRFDTEPQEFISGLFDTERTTIAILGESTNPLMPNQIRNEFIDRIVDNLRLNMKSMLKQIEYEKVTIKGENMDIIQKVGELLMGLNELDLKGKKPAEKAKYLGGLFKKTPESKKTRLQLIPSFDYFNGLMGGLEAIGILEPRPSPDDRAQWVYSLKGKFYDKWETTSKRYLAGFPKEYVKDRHYNPITSINNKEAAFYGLTNKLLEYDIALYEEQINHVKKNPGLKKAKDWKLEDYRLRTLTDSEEMFIVSSLGLVRS